MNSFFKYRINHLLHRFGYKFTKLRPRKSTYFIKDTFGNQPLIGVEIGTFMGENAKTILDTLNIEKLYLIDPYIEYIDEQKIPHAPYYRRFSHRLLKKYKNVVFIRKVSSEALPFIKEKVDFAYIDGNHEYEYVKKDLELYFAILKDGGVLSGHDYIIPDVKKAVDEFAKKNKLKVFSSDMKTYEDLDWWIVK